MGDPRKHRKKFKGPAHPWQKERIDEEKALRKEYGLKNKKEIWRADSFKKNAARQAKQLAIDIGQQAEIQKQQLFKKLQRLGLLKQDAELGDILAISTRDVLERRLQTQVCKRMLAHSNRQARQFITHGHIKVGDHKVDSPCYLVSLDEETQISFIDNSALADPEHPERAVEKKDIEEEAKKITSKKDKATKEKMTKESKKLMKEASEKKAPETKEAAPKESTPKETPAEKPAETKEESPEAKEE